MSLSLQLIPESLSVHQHPCLCLVSQPSRCVNAACFLSPKLGTHSEWAVRTALESAACPLCVSVSCQAVTAHK